MLYKHKLFLLTLDSVFLLNHTFEWILSLNDRHIWKKNILTNWLKSSYFVAFSSEKNLHLNFHIRDSFRNWLIRIFLYRGVYSRLLILTSLVHWKRLNHWIYIWISVSVSCLYILQKILGILGKLFHYTSATRHSLNIEFLLPNIDYFKPHSFVLT